MNYTVLRGADTVWGQQFALKLASEKRHLILLGKNMFVLTDLALRIRNAGKQEVAVYQIDTGNTKSIAAVCDTLNAGFEIDCFINYVEYDEVTDKWAERSVFELDQLLKSTQLASFLLTHQLLPNLLLHGQPEIMHVFDKVNARSPTGRWMIESTCLFFENLQTEYKEGGLRVQNIPAKLLDSNGTSLVPKRTNFC
jgi:short-subunit dehydrogenase